MKLIIAGGRDYELTVHDFVKLERLRSQVTEVVSGGARGVDSSGEMWAASCRIPVKRFPADWSLGKRAGMLRNEQMAKYADAVALFPGGRGTQNMFDTARKHGLEIHDFRNPDALL